MIEVKLPAGPKDLRIMHYKSMALVPEEMEMTTQDKLHFLAEFLGLRYNQMLGFTLDQINKMTELAVKALAKMDVRSEIPQVITLAKQEFQLIDPDKIGIGWHIDFQNCDIVKDPVRLACLFYVQKGYSYSDVDENGNITHPIASRYDLFRDEFPLDLFIRCANFFLKRSLLSIERSTVREIAHNKSKAKTLSMIKSLNLLPGRNPLKPLWKRSSSRGIKR